MLNEFQWQVRVYYEDTDCGGVVYYANYLKFMERARTEWLRAHGFEQDVLRTQHGVIFAVRSVAIDYLQPAKFNDALRISVRPLELGRASLEVAQEVTRDNSSDVLASARVRLACLDAARFRPRPIPETMIEGMSVDG